MKSVGGGGKARSLSREILKLDKCRTRLGVRRRDSGSKVWVKKWGKKKSRDDVPTS